MEDINPIKNVIETPFVTNAMVIAFFAVLVVVLLATAWFFYSRYRKKKIAQLSEIKPAEIIPEKDYFVEAMARMEKVKILLEKRLYKEFYLEVTVVVKEFLSGVQKMNIVDMTSRETIASTGLDDDRKAKLTEFLGKADEAKFSGSSGSAVAEEAFVLADDLIKSIANKT